MDELDNSDVKSDEIFEGKTLPDLLKEIYELSINKNEEISKFINDISTYITDIKGVILVAPVIKDLMTTSIKNDEMLIKLAQLVRNQVQFIKVPGDNANEDIILSRHDREQIKQELDGYRKEAAGFKKEIIKN
ncbi:MAG: hypothetical protein M0R17_13415 [Candidatus Omnitrophica bacterium]|jgi:hypothetical protein|nr:hypothetical protein [Candidatus Omnitrophota bacterium]